MKTLLPSTPLAMAICRRYSEAAAMALECR